MQFAQWQADLLESDEEDARDGRDFWAKRQFAPIAASLPSEKKTEQPFQPAVLAISAGNDPSRTMLSADPAAHLLSAWQILLARLSGQNLFSVGFHADGREYEELENGVGCFARTFPVRAQVEATFRFSDVLGQSVQSIRDSIALQEYFAPEAIGIDGELVSFSYQDLGAKQTFDGVGFTVERVHVVS